ncbi:hypothetical protein [Clostridium moutaii]|uniref:hypothetical protein n=1 Tax=Clostridium moutaii TaxID=3240932 RepID=UPI0035101D11
MKITERMRICILKNKYDGVENVTCSFGLASLQKNDNTDYNLFLDVVRWAETNSEGIIGGK